MTYEEIKQRTYDILNMPFEEANRLHYTDKIPRIVNEALFRIAHSVLPNLREYVVRLTPDILPVKLTMPPDFISFADEQNAYLNGKAFILTDFIGTDGIILTGGEVDTQLKLGEYLNSPYEYHIFYNALYPRIIEGGINYSRVVFAEGIMIPTNSDNYKVENVPVIGSRVTGEGAYDIPDIAGQLVPHYVAGQLLVLDDKVRSIEEMNEFEVLLASINTHRNERPREYHSSKGWY